MPAMRNAGTRVPDPMDTFLVLYCRKPRFFFLRSPLLPLPANFSCISFGHPFAPSHLSEAERSPVERNGGKGATEKERPEKERPKQVDLRLNPVLKQKAASSLWAFTISQ